MDLGINHLFHRSRGIFMCSQCQTPLIWFNLSHLEKQASRLGSSCNEALFRPHMLSPIWLKCLCVVNCVLLLSKLALCSPHCKSDNLCTESQNTGCWLPLYQTRIVQFVIRTVAMAGRRRKSSMEQKLGDTTFWFEDFWHSMSSTLERWLIPVVRRYFNWYVLTVAGEENTFMSTVSLYLFISGLTWVFVCVCGVWQNVGFWKPCK